MDDQLKDRIRDAYHDLSKFVQWLANERAVRNHWMLNRDDLIAEGFFVIIKTAYVYKDKPYDEFLVLTRVAMKNHFSTLRYTALLTHRKADLSVYSLNAEFDQDAKDGKSESDYSLLREDGSTAIYEAFSDHTPTICMDPAKFCESMERLEEAVVEMDEFDRRVLNALLGGNERVRIYLSLQRQRKHWVYNDPTISVNPLVVSRALCEDIEEVKKAFARLALLF